MKTKKSYKPDEIDLLLKDYKLEEEVKMSGIRTREIVELWYNKEVSMVNDIVQLRVSQIKSVDTCYRFINSKLMDINNMLEESGFDTENFKKIIRILD